MKKNIITIINSTVLGIIIGGGIHKFFFSNKNKEKKVEGNKEKFRVYYNALKQWLTLKNRGRNLEEYFIANNYDSIAIYGMGELGNRLLEELESSQSVKVKYGIDKNASSNYSNIEIKSTEDVIEDIDLIVVSAIFDYENIKMELSQRTECLIVSLEDIIFSL